MKFTLEWTDLAKSDIINNLTYLRLEWGQQTALNFMLRVIETLELVSLNPATYKVINKRLNVRRFILNSRISLYYQLRKEDIVLITFWHNSKNPRDLRKTIRKTSVATI